MDKSYLAWAKMSFSHIKMIKSVLKAKLGHVQKCIFTDEKDYAYFEGESYRRLTSNRGKSERKVISFPAFQLLLLIPCFLAQWLWAYLSVLHYFLLFDSVIAPYLSFFLVTQEELIFLVGISLRLPQSQSFHVLRLPELYDISLLLFVYIFFFARCPNINRSGWHDIRVQV